MTEWINGISKPKVYELEDFLDDVKDSRIEALERENARLRDINAILEDCMSKGMVIRKKETE